MCSRSVWLAWALVLVKVLRIARARPGVPEDKERESILHYLHGRDGEADQDQGHESEYHPVPGRDLPALRVALLIWAGGRA
jgi:hypothetical protein